jgi:hypothetical protein
VFLWSSSVHRDRCAGGNGLLPLRLLPPLVCSAGKRIHAVEARCGPRDPGWGLTDVYAASIPGFPFRGGVHVNYQETLLPIKDGLPKFKDVPADMGGSGTLVAE